MLKDSRYHGLVGYEQYAQHLISVIIDIAAKKLPSDLPYSNKQLDQIIQKIKFVPIPKNIVDEDVYKEEQVDVDGETQTVKVLVQQKTTNERAIVRLRIPKKRIEEDYVEVDEATGAEVHKKHERLVEMEQDDKVLIFPALLAQKDYSIYSFNQNAPRAHRRDFFNAIKRTFAENFEGRDAQKDYDHFVRHGEEIYEKVERKFIEENYHEEKMPVIDFEINLNDND